LGQTISLVSVNAVSAPRTTGLRQVVSSVNSENVRRKYLSYLMYLPHSHHSDRV
jgi:hypothetical protein